MAQPTVGHLDPAFIGMMDELNELVRYALQTEHECTFTISGPGSAGMEAALGNLVQPGDAVAVCRNGVFAERMRQLVLRNGGTPVDVEGTWGQPIEPGLLDRTLAEHPTVEIVAFVHAETSTGVLNDAPELSRVAREHGCLTVVDCVASAGGVPVRVDEWGLDVAYTGSQKCFSCPPGLAPITLSDRALQRVRERKNPPASWLFDIRELTRYWGEGHQRRSYHHTAPINALYALHEALCMLREEGLDVAWARHRDVADLLCRGLDAIGLQLPVDPACRLPQLQVVTIPEGVDDAAVRQRLLNEFSIEIGAGLGPGAGKVWRIGMMGYGARSENVLALLRALAIILKPDSVEEVQRIVQDSLAA